MIGFKSTYSRIIGLVLVIAALSAGTASASTGGPTPQGLKADGLRLQGMAERYVELRGTTQAGLIADGLRWQAMANAYNNRPAASFYTARQLRAEGLRWQAMARAYAQPQTASARGSSFDWGAAGLGAAGVFVVMLCIAVAIMGVRRVREEKLAV
jgi:hypothetical protein